MRLLRADGTNGAAEVTQQDYANQHRRKLSRKAIDRLEKQQQKRYRQWDARCNRFPDKRYERRQKGANRQFVDKRCFTINGVARIVTRREQRKHLRMHAWFMRLLYGSVFRMYSRRPW